jgi:hypothetical protein
MKKQKNKDKQQKKQKNKDKQQKQQEKEAQEEADRQAAEAARLAKEAQEEADRQAAAVEAARLAKEAQEEADRRAAAVEAARLAKEAQEEADRQAAAVEAARLAQEVKNTDTIDEINRKLKAQEKQEAEERLKKWGMQEVDYHDSDDDETTFSKSHHNVHVRTLLRAQRGEDADTIDEISKKLKQLETYQPTQTNEIAQTEQDINGLIAVLKSSSIEQSRKEAEQIEKDFKERQEQMKAAAAVQPATQRVDDDKDLLQKTLQESKKRQEEEKKEIKATIDQYNKNMTIAGIKDVPEKIDWVTKKLKDKQELLSDKQKHKEYEKQNGVGVVQVTTKSFKYTISRVTIITAIYRCIQCTSTSTSRSSTTIATSSRPRGTRA